MDLIEKKKGEPMGAYDCDCIENLEYYWREEKRGIRIPEPEICKKEPMSLIDRIKRCEFSSTNQKEIREIAVGMMEEIEDIKRKISIMSSAQPERKTGKWEYLMDFLWKCSECGGRFDVPYNFCPNCGIEMERWRSKEND